MNTILLQLFYIIVLSSWYDRETRASASHSPSLSSSYLNTRSLRNEEDCQTYSRGFWNSSLRKTRSSSGKAQSRSKCATPNKEADLKLDFEPQEESIMTIAVDQKNHRSSKKNNLFLLLDCTLELLSNDPDQNDGEQMTTLLDTGAQATFLSVSAARRAGILHLMDTRYAGHAKGVGGIPTKVLGRIPANTLKLSFQDGLFQVSPSILILSSPSDDEDDNKIDLLLGMDLLLEWQAQICLQKMQLIIVPPNSLNGNSNMMIRIPFINTQEQSISRKNNKAAFINHSKSKAFHRSQNINDDIDPKQDVHDHQQQQQQTLSESDLESDLDWLDNYKKSEPKRQNQQNQHFSPPTNENEYDSAAIRCNNIVHDRMDIDNNEKNKLQEDEDESDDWDDGDDEELFDLSGI